MESSSTDSGDAEFKIEDFDEHVRGLETLLGIANTLSNVAAGPEYSYIAYQASLVFCKLSLGALATLRFIPRSRYHAETIAKATDLPSASVLALQVLSDTITFLYLADRNITEEDREFRKFIWDLQELKQSYDFLKLNDEKNPILNELKPELARRFDLFDRHPLSKQISDGIKGQIKAGRRALWKSNFDILNGYGLMKKCYDVPFLIFSNFVHASALSTHLIVETRAKNEESWRRFLFGIVNATAFFAVDIQAFIETFPVTRTRISEAGIALLKAYSQPVRKRADDARNQ